MKYNLSNALDKKQAEIKFKYLCDKGAEIELTEKRKVRTIPQNKYLHVLFQIWALEYGRTLKEAKHDIKKECPFGSYERNGTMYPVETSKMSTKELSEFVDWFRSWSAKNGLYLHTSEEYLIEKSRIDREIQKAKQYL